jgi:hypothetical protein
MSANERNPRRRTSSFSKREKIRRKPSIAGISATQLLGSLRYRSNPPPAWDQPEDQGAVAPRENLWAGASHEKNPNPTTHRLHWSAVECGECPKTIALLPESRQSLQFDLRRVLYSTPGCNLDPIRRKCRIVTECYQHGDVNQCSCGSCVGPPVSSASRRMPLPLGPVSSARTMIKPRSGSNEKVKARLPYSPAYCPYIRSRIFWVESERSGGIPRCGPCHDSALFHRELRGTRRSMGPQSRPTRTRIFPQFRRLSGLHPSVIPSLDYRPRGSRRRIGASASVQQRVDALAERALTKVCSVMTSARARRQL